MSTTSPSGPVAPALPDVDAPRSRVLLAIADDALVSGHRASHWTGVAPSIEEDLAFSTIAQDGISQADLWYHVLLGDGAGRAAVDALGLGRGPDGYRHAIVCERPPRDFASTLARHWVTVHFEQIRLDVLTGSSDGDVAAVATRLLHELRYHLEHAEHWFRRLAQGGDEPHRRLHEALADVVPEALGFFEPVPEEDEVVAGGLLPVGHDGLRSTFVSEIGPRLEDVGYGELVPDDGDTAPDRATGGRAGRHSTDFTDDVWPEMTALYRAHPGARW